MTNNEKEEEELIKETIAECNEHFDKSIQLLIEIERNGELFRQDYFDAIFRTLHSAKGYLAMVGLNAASELVHECESLFQKCANEKCFFKGIIQITIEFMAQLQEAFMHKKNDLQKLDYVKYCFPCIENSAYKEKCENHVNVWTKNLPCRSKHTTSIKLHNNEMPSKINCDRLKISSATSSENVVLLGANSAVVLLLKKLKISFTHISSPDEFYKEGHLYNKIETFLIDSKSCKPNPLLCIGIINNLFPAKKIILISDEGILNFKEAIDIDIDKLNFTFLGIKSKVFESQIMLALQK